MATPRTVVHRGDGRFASGTVSLLLLRFLLETETDALHQLSCESAQLVDEMLHHGAFRHLLQLLRPRPSRWRPQPPPSNVLPHWIQGTDRHQSQKCTPRP